MAAASLGTVPGSGHSGNVCGTRPGDGDHARIPSLAREDEGGAVPPPGSAMHHVGYDMRPELTGRPHRDDHSQRVIVACHLVLGHSVMDDPPFGSSDLAP